MKPPLFHHFLLTTLLLLPQLSLSSYIKLPIFSTTTTISYSPNSTHFLVSLPLGSPPQPLPLLLLTSSDLLWSLCSLHHPNPHYQHHHPHPNHHRHPPTFHPLLSSSFLRLPCSHPLCHPSCNLSTPTHPHPCPFLSSPSTSSSPSASLLLSLDSTHFPNSTTIAFGCALHSAVHSSPAAAGVLPLGRGPTSLPSQLSPHLGSPSFSYCLPPSPGRHPSRRPTTYLVLGRYRRHLRHHLSFTPLFRNPLSPSLYYISIVGVEIDGTQLAVDPDVFSLDAASGAGGTVLDTGTALSLLPEEAYRRVLAGMERRLRLPRVTVPGFDLCVNASGIGGRELPRLGLRMRGGAILSPPPRNYFVGVGGGVRCLALQPTVGPAGAGVVGSLMQRGFLMAFDRERERLGFSRSGCAAA